MNVFDNRPDKALAFLNSEHEHIEQDVKLQPFPETKYNVLLPVDTSAPDWVGSISFKTLDFKGRPERLGQQADDIPFVEMASGKGSVNVHDFVLGYKYTLSELNEAADIASRSRSAMLNLLAEKPRGVRQITEHWLDQVFFVGDGSETDDIKSGLFNDADVPTYTTGDFLPGGTDKTIDDILGGSDADVVANELLQLFNNAYHKVRVDQTKTVYRPTHFVLPPDQMGKLESYRIPNTSDTLISYLERVVGRNRGSGSEGPGVTFAEHLSLQGLGNGGTDRMMVYTRDETYVKAHMPHPFGLQAPATPNNIVFTSAGIVRVAGTELRIPKQHSYVDGV